MSRSTTNFYEVLGVAPSATEKELKTARRNKLGENHSDKFQQASEEVQRRARARFRQVQRAYAVLGDAAARARHDEELAREVENQRNEEREEQEREQAKKRARDSNKPTPGFLVLCVHSDVGDTVYKVLIGAHTPTALVAAKNAVPGSLGRWLVRAHAAVDDIEEAEVAARKEYGPWRQPDFLRGAGWLLNVPPSEDAAFTKTVNAGWTWQRFDNTESEDLKEVSSEALDAFKVRFASKREQRKRAAPKVLGFLAAFVMTFSIALLAADSRDDVSSVRPSQLTTQRAAPASPPAPPAPARAGCGLDGAPAELRASIHDWPSWTCQDEEAVSRGVWSLCIGFRHYAEPTESCAGEQRCCAPNEQSAMAQEDTIREYRPMVCGRADAAPPAGTTNWDAYRCRQSGTLPAALAATCLRRSEYSIVEGEGCVTGMLCCRTE